MDSFAGKAVIITGAASGIGRATAIAFARLGASLVLADLNEATGVEVVAEANAAGGQAVFIKTDVAAPHDCERMVALAKTRFGRLDAAFNNAGVSGSDTRAPTGEYALESWTKVIGINLSGVFHCLHYEIPLMLQSGGGSIVNTASVAGLVSFTGIPAYVASKHGVIGLTKAVCNEYAAQGIRCNVVAPGHVATPMNQGYPGIEAEIPQGRMGQSEELAEAVVWLCSPAASYVNGACLPVDGGFLVR